MEEMKLPEDAYVMDAYYIGFFPAGAPEGVPKEAVAVITMVSDRRNAVIFLTAEGWQQFVYNVRQTDMMMKAVVGRQN